MNKQQGFSLIELAIVLVIAGLLMAGVLRGQEWIANAKVKSLAADFRNIPAYFMGYQDRFRVLPGDDQAANTHLTGGVKATTEGHAQNGLLQGAWNSTTPTDESYLVWQHLRLAGLMNGSTDTSDKARTSYVPKNSEGGTLGVTSLTNVSELSADGIAGAHAVCSASILGRYALQLDTMLDDGAAATGAMRILTEGATASAGATTVAAGSPYLVCMSF